MNKLTVTLIVLFLTGCATQSKIVYVPTPVKCPAPHIPPEPKYRPISKDAAPAEYVKAMTVNYKMCRDDAKALRLILKGYNYDY